MVRYHPTGLLDLADLYRSYPDETASIRPSHLERLLSYPLDPGNGVLYRDRRMDSECDQSIPDPPALPLGLSKKADGRR